MNLDQKDCAILDILQQDCRTSLTKIAGEIGLSIDSTRKRLQNLQQKGIFRPKIQLRPRKFNFPILVNVRIKLHNYDDDQMNEFIAHLQQHHRVTEVFALSGDWDFAIVIMSKDHEDLSTVTDAIRSKFKDIIGDWSELLTKYVHKFEEYDMQRLYSEMEGKR